MGAEGGGKGPSDTAGECTLALGGEKVIQGER